MKVQHSDWSRITNETVFSYVGAHKLNILLLEQQLLVFGKIARRPCNYVVRRAISPRRSNRTTCSNQNKMKKETEIIMGFRRGEMRWSYVQEVYQN